MNRMTRGFAASLVAMAALGAGSVALAPPAHAPAPAMGGFLGELLESLLVMRDGHGARLPAEEPTSRRTP